MSMRKPSCRRRIRSAVIVLALVSQFVLHSLVSRVVETDISRYLNNKNNPHDFVELIHYQQTKTISVRGNDIHSNLRSSLDQAGVKTPNDVAPPPDTSDNSNMNSLLTQQQHKYDEDQQNQQLYPINLNKYWNLSCPAELTMFSGAHMGGDYLERAQQAFQLSQSELSRRHPDENSIIDNLNHLKGDRKIFFIGDSLLRQVFISFACLHWDQVDQYAIPWFTQRRGVRAKHPHTLTEGPHSKFEEARIRFQNGLELIFHHGTGKLIKLGPEYQSQEKYSWMEACYRRKPLQTFVPQLDHPDDEASLTIDNVQHETITLSNKDIVIFNGSVHGERLVNLQVIHDFLQCQQRMHYPTEHWPSMMYVMTGATHFPTETGAFEEDLLETSQDFECSQTSQHHGYQDDETRILKDVLPMIGQEILDKYEYSNGHLHVGGRDCLHWLQPGIPDLLAASLQQYLMRGSGG